MFFDMVDSESAQPPIAGAARLHRVLVVEDSEELRQLYAIWLRERGYEVFEAADGRAAWNLIMKLHPDVVVLDLGLPSVDGWKVATLLRLDRRRRTPALIAVTGQVEPDAIQAARDAGVDAVLLKPCTAEAMANAIETELVRMTVS